MKQLSILLLIGVLILTACVQTPEDNLSTLQVPVVETTTFQNFTSTPLPSKTPQERANEPTNTPRPPTPLPTIPTFTPTFAASTILTVTPAPKAECPEQDPSLAPTFYVPKHPDCFDTDQCIFSGTEQEILEFLNKGGTLQAVISKLRTAIYGDYKDYRYQDVTGDDIPELMFLDFAATPNLHIFYCKDETYSVFTLNPGISGNIVQFTWLESILDLNLNSLPEIIFSTRGCMGSGCFVIFTLEWDGSAFTNLSPQVAMWGVTDLNIQDTDNNGTKEIILIGDSPGIGTYSMMVPWRLKTQIYSWDGQEYVLASEDFAPPEFRFQAVQDADRYSIEQEYNQAFTLYNAIIFSDKLDWWSAEKRMYYVNDLDPWIMDNTPGPLPAPDLTEYPRLAAYAYYRIMLLHIVQGNEAESETAYQTLQQKFANDPYAELYVEMAAAFWDTYQSTHKVYDGCAAAIQYAAEHPEILIPLGSDYHGSQSHLYAPADVCPFR